MIDKVLLSLIILTAVTFDCSQALQCFTRIGSSTADNGTATTCNTGYNYCYSYSTNGLNYGGCVSSDICSVTSYTDCTLCSTDNCNNMNPTVISCYSRSGSSSSTNGTMTRCHSRISNCYSYTDSQYNLTYGGCGTCAGTTPSCINCNTDYCNSVTPSAISCFYRPSSTSSNGSVVTCITGISTCFSYDSYGVSAGCGSPKITDLLSSLSYRTCSTDNCNSLTPFRCYSRTGYSTGNGSPISCATGINTCFSYTWSSWFNSYTSNYSGCGSCNSSSGLTSCVTCDTDLCNTRTPSSITCYATSLYNSYSLANGQLVSCPTGVTSCFYFSSFGCGNTRPGIWSSTVNYLYTAGCGTCSADSIPSCVTCSTSYCNAMLPSSISCYWRHALSTTYSGSSYACPAGITSCFSLSTAMNDTVEGFQAGVAGCGVCTPTTTSLYGCTSCSTSNCNSISYIITAAPVTNSQTPNSAFTAAPVTNSLSVNPAVTQPSGANPNTNSTVNSCYFSYGDSQYNSRQKVSCSSSSSCFEYSFQGDSKSYFFAGCGPCPFNGSSTSCRTCYTDYCNSALSSSGIRCHYSFGKNNYKDREQVTCPTSSSCFEYSFSSLLTNYFFAGCGNCSFNGGSTNCRTCFTDYCNSGSSSIGSAFTAAASIAMVLAMIKVL